MFRLVRALLTTAVIVYFLSLGIGTTVADPAPSWRPTTAGLHAQLAPVQPLSPAKTPVSRPGATVPFIATAYCQRGVTRSGADTHSGIAAADPAELPVGSVVHVHTTAGTYDGIYTVLDTGSKVQGQKVDLFMHNCGEARQFGKQQARVTVLRKGWSPKATAPKTVALAGK